MVISDRISLLTILSNAYFYVVAMVRLCKIIVSNDEINFTMPRSTDDLKIDKYVDNQAITNMPVQHAQAILMLAQGYKQVEVARTLNVHHNTIWRWLKNNDFAELVAHARAVMYEGVLNVVNAKAVEMVETLAEIASQRNNMPGRDRAIAAAKILDIQYRGKQVELEEKLEALQAQMEELTEQIKNLKQGAIEIEQVETFALYD